MTTEAPEAAEAGSACDDRCVRCSVSRSSLVVAAAALFGVLLPAAAAAGGDLEPIRLKVYAASSLTDALTAIGRAFEAANDDVDAALVFAGSQVLRLQIEQGAPADLFASADPEHARALHDAGLLRGVRSFATNELAVIVPLDNPAGIESFGDLAAAERLVIGTASVPVGRYTRAALRRSAAALGAEFEATVLAHVVSLENNVRLVRAKVELGEADAGIVYRTDAAASTRVRTIPIPAAFNERAEYVIGIVPNGGGAEPAERWIAFLLSPEGQAILHAHGFLAPF